MSFNNSRSEMPAHTTSTQHLSTSCLGSTAISIDTQTPSASAHQDPPICATTILPAANHDQGLLIATPTAAVHDPVDLISLETAGTGSTHIVLNSCSVLLEREDEKEGGHPHSTYEKGDSAMFNNFTLVSGNFTASMDQEEQGRHPRRLQGSWYTRLFRLERSDTRSNVIVQSSWLSTGGLLMVRSILFLYTMTVLIADICRTERPRYEFCYLTQLSYLGLTAYLGTVSWHTLSEWRHKRARRHARANDALAQAEAQLQQPTAKTTIERQHWLLTDMNFFLYHTICTFHVIVPLVYWTYLSYQGEAHIMAAEVEPDALWRNYSFHGGDIIIVLIEIAINTMPFIPSHVLFVFLACLLYLAEAHVVYHVDGFWIYPFLDTTQGPIWVALYFGVGFLILCAFIVMYFLHRVKYWAIARSTRRHRVLQVQDGKRVQRNPNVASPGNMEITPEMQMRDSYESTLASPQEPAPVQYLYKHRRITELANQNRKRSGTSKSEDSTASTLVGFETPKVREP
ncbi:MAG: hypothetical protein J3Q66DRAFT_344932 [Benniella sp.]|nr:MAG: hypothetical protein J3Q66DRAFT_344932 [Benniella sp.]